MFTTFASSSAFSAASSPPWAALRSSCSIAGVDAAAYEKGGRREQGEAGWVGAGAQGSDRVHPPTPFPPHRALPPPCLPGVCPEEAPFNRARLLPRDG